YHIRQGGTRNRYATDAVLRTQKTDIGSACNEILHQHQIRRIIFDVEQGLQLRLPPGSRLVVSCGSDCLCDSLRRSRQAQFDPEHAPLPDCAFRSDCATHQAYQTLAYHQADTGTFFGARLLSKTIERLEKLRKLFPGKSHAGVPDADTNGIRMAKGTLHGNRSTRPVVFYRIGKKVDENLLHPCPVGVDKEGSLETGKDHSDAALLRLRSHHGLAFVQDFGQRYRLQ